MTVDTHRLRELAEQVSDHDFDAADIMEDAADELDQVRVMVERHREGEHMTVDTEPPVNSIVTVQTYHPTKPGGQPSPMVRLAEGWCWLDGPGRPLSWDELGRLYGTVTLLWAPDSDAAGKADA